MNSTKLTANELKQIALKKYPALAIGLSPKEIEWATAHQSFRGLTAHQKAAIRLVADRQGWHPEYVATCGAVQARPRLIAPYGQEEQWEFHCEAWQLEHDASLEVLAEKIEAIFIERATRLFEPLCTHKDGVIMSTHDDDQYRYPCPVSQW
jgi:hypothetical protein